MTSQTRSRKWWSKDLKPLKDKIVKTLSGGPKRWIELENNQDVYSLAGSNATLSKALKELIREGVVEQGIISHRNRPYFLSEDAEALRSLDKVETLLSRFREALSNIETYSDEPQVSQNEVEATQSTLFRIQLIFLKTLDIISNTNPAAQPYIKTWFIDEIINTMIEIYTVYQNRLPMTTQRAMFQVTKRITEEAKTTNTSNIVELEKINTIFTMLVAQLYEIPIRP